MKHFSLILMAIFLVMILSTSNTFASVSPASNVELMAENYLNAKAFIQISDGKAVVSGQIIGKAGTTTKTSVHLYLQQYKNGNWINIDDWVSSGNTVSRALSKTKSVTKGYKYRAKAFCTALSIQGEENITKYSAFIMYE